MGKTKKTGNLVNVVVTDNDNNVTLPKALTLGEQPLLTDDSLKVPTTNWVNSKLGTNGLPIGGTTGQLLAKQSNTNYDVIWTSQAPYTSVVKHSVKAGEALTKGQAVYVSGADGTNMIVTKASNTTEATSSKTMGLISQTLATNGQGEVVTEGLLSGLNTSTATIGDPVWLGVSGELIYGLINKPYAPAHLVFIGVVTRVSATVGEIFVNVQNGFELQEIHNVDLKTNAPVNGQVLGFDGTLWVNKTIAGWLGFTPVTSARTLTINGTAQDLSADRSWSVGSVTSVAALTLGTTGTDLSSTVATGTTTPVITLNVPTASASNRGVLSASDWTTFNNKQPQLNGTGFVKASGTSITYDNSTYLSTISGITAGGELSGTYPNPTILNSAVVAKILTGVNITGGSISASDSILTAFGKIQNQINGLLGGSIYQSTWNASTNLPTLLSSTGTKGYYYIVNVAGSTNLNGITDWKVGDWAIFDGTAWQKVDNTDAVSSVNGLAGAVSLTTDNISEGTSNLYFTTSRARGSISGNTGISYNSSTGVISSTITQYTDALARAAISLTVNNNSGASTYNSTTGVLNVPTYTLAGLGGQTQLNGTGFVKASGTTISYDNTTYQPLLTNPITGTGTTNYLPKFTGASTLGNSLIYDNGTNVGIGTSSPSAKLHVIGSSIISNNLGVDTFTWNGGKGGLSYGTGLVTIETNDPTAIAFFTNSAERLRITSAGNVGIGTTSPTSIGGFTTLALNGSTGGLFDLMSSGTTYGRLYSLTNNLIVEAVGASNMQFAANGAERLRITSAGNVGIGTTAPALKLHIVGGGVSSSISNVATTSSFRIDTANPAISAVIGYDGSDNVFIQSVNSSTNTIKPLLINPYGGNVGINTTSPSEKLHVIGNGLFSGTVTASNGALVGGTGVSNVWTGTQSAYDAIATKSSTTIYFIQ